MTPTEALATAQQLLDRPDAKTAGLWPRAAALLARQALEQSLDAFWKTKGLALAALPMRPQLLCLPRYLDDAPLAASLSHTWTALTHACHHHPYELPPTAQELGTLFDTVDELLDAVEAGGVRG